LEILFFLKGRKRHVCVLEIAAKVLSYRSMNCRYDVHSTIRNFSGFYQEAMIFAKPKLLAKFKVRLSEIILAQSFLFIHKYFFSEIVQDEELLVLHYFLSAKIPLPGLV